MRSEMDFYIQPPAGEGWKGKDSKPPLKQGSLPRAEPGEELLEAAGLAFQAANKGALQCGLIDANQELSG